MPVSNALPASLVKSFTSTGTLRASINLGNAILANRHPQTAAPVGVSIDLAHEFARRLGVAVELIVFDGAAKSVEAVRQEQADIGFFAIDPLRGAGIQFTAPYVLIEGSYLVRQDSPLQHNVQVDTAGMRVAVGQGSAYDLFLTRELKAAQIVRADGAAGATTAFYQLNLEVLAGIRQMLEAETTHHPNLRLLAGRFMVIQQAMGCPTSRGAVAGEFLRQFVEDMKTSGFVADALQRHRIAGATVAPPV